MSPAESAVAASVLLQALLQDLLTLVGKLAPGFRSILSNSEGPLMDLFGQFTREAAPHRSPSPAVGHHPAPASPATELPDRPFTRTEDRR